jgi:hypothetical protein
MPKSLKVPLNVGEPLEQHRFWIDENNNGDLLSGFGISKKSNLHASNIFVYWSKIVL